MSCEVSDKSKNGSSKADHLNTRIPYGIRPVVKVRSYTLIVFQSTHPVWDATCCSQSKIDAHKFQSTHPIWDATDQITQGGKMTDISIHASRMGCDSTIGRSFSEATSFQSTHPVWDATDAHAMPAHTGLISIHASRMGCDQVARRLGQEFGTSTLNVTNTESYLGERSNSLRQFPLVQLPVPCLPIAAFQDDEAIH